MDIKKINYKSDFTIRMTSDAGWGTAFRVRFRAKGTPQKKYYASHDGNGNFINCHIDENDPTTLVVAFDDHHLGVGVLLCEITYTLVDDSYPTEKYDSVANEKPVKTVINGDEYIVVLDIDGDESAIIVWQLPAFEAEAEREAAEEGRRTAEAARQQAELSRQTAEAGRDEAETIRQELADHPQYVGEDGYVYTYCLDDHAYHRTDVYLKGPKGDTGNSGYSGDISELEVVNNLTDGGAEAALSAEMGKRLADTMPKLYPTTGENTDGSMTQASISEMAEFKTLRRTTTFETSGTNQKYNGITDLAAGEYVVEVDTPVAANNAKLKTLLFRNGTTNVQTISNIPLDGNTHVYTTTFETLITRVYLWEFNPTGSYGQIAVRIYTKTGNYSRLDSIPYDLSAYNNKAQYSLSAAVVAIPSEKRQVGMQLKFIGEEGYYLIYQYKGNTINNIEDISYWQLLECTQKDIPYDVSAYNSNTIYTLYEAIKLIPENVQKVGMMIKFINPNKRYSIYKYIGNTLANIENKQYWEQVVGSEEELKGDLTVVLQGNYSMVDYGINANENSENFGTAVSENSSVWATPHIKCSGYDYLYVTLYPTSNTTYYKYGCVFYDENRSPIHGYGSMAFQASSSNTDSSVYNFPRCLEIPANAITFRTTYRKNQYPSIKLITGAWDSIPIGARYSYTYYGERIEMKKPHKAYLTHYGKYTSGLSTNQAGCAYGDYLFLFGQKNNFSVVEYSNPAGAAKNPIQANIAIPNMKTSDGNSVIHNDGVGFTDVFYEDGDDFPMLVCGGGYAQNATGTTYFYVVRVVKNDDGNGTVTFTPTVIQEITVISGIATWTSDSCLNIFYDTDRHVIIVSGKGYTWVTKYNVSKTAGDFTIDLRDPSSYTRIFYQLAGSGSYYNGHLYAANNYNNNTRIRFRSLNVITGEVTEIILARHFEPEAVFAWNNELYLLEVGNLFKLYFD